MAVSLRSGVLAAGLLLCLSGCSQLLQFDKNYSVGSDAGGTQGSGAYYKAVMADSPALYLRLGEASGSVAKDEVGKHPGTYPIAGVTYGVPGAIAHDPNTAVEFDGDHHITMPPSFDLAPDTPYTLEVWAKQTAYDGSGFAIDHDDYNANRNGWDLFFAQDKVNAERWNNGSPNGSAVGTSSGLPLGAYHYVALTFDPSGSGIMCIFVDGAKVRCGIGAGAPIVSTGITWSIGSQNCNCTSNGFVGALDEFALYTHVLSPAQIAAHYHAGIGH